MVIELKKVTKIHDKCSILKGIDLSLQKEGIYGLIGTNGCGKTTLIRLLTGYFYPTEGQISILGYDMLSEAPSALAQMGYWPEKNALYENMSVLEYLNFIGKAKNLAHGELQASLEELLETFSLTNISNKLTQTLSKGYAQRVGLASAFLGSPRLVILDEPLTGLDPSQILSFRHFLLRKASQMSLLLSSHHLNELEHICDKLILMEEGNIKAVGSLEELGEKIAVKQFWQIEFISKSPSTTQLLQNCELFEIISLSQIEDVYKLLIKLKENTEENAMLAWLQSHTLTLKSLSQPARNLHKLLNT